MTNNNDFVPAFLLTDEALKERTLAAQRDCEIEVTAEDLAKARESYAEFIYRNTAEGMQRSVIGIQAMCQGGDPDQSSITNAQRDYDNLRAVSLEELERLAIQNAPLMQNHVPVADESMRNAIRNYGRVPEADWAEDGEHSDYDDSGLDMESTGAFAAHRETVERFTWSWKEARAMLVWAAFGTFCGWIFWLFLTQG